MQVGFALLVTRLMFFGCTVLPLFILLCYIFFITDVAFIAGSSSKV